MVRVEEAVDYLLALGAGVGIVGLVCLSLYMAGLPMPLIQTDPITGHVTTYSVMWEANIFGSFEMIVASLAFSRIIGEGISHARARASVAIFLVAMLALLISFTRAAWIGFFVALSLQVFLSRRELQLGRRIVGGIFAGSIAIGVVFLIGAGQTLLNRMMSLGEVETGTLAFRLIRWKLAWDQFLGSPLLGLGTNSFGQRFTDPSQHDAPDYLPSLFLQALYDTGLLGFALLLGFFGYLVWGLWRRQRIAPERSDRVLARGLLATLCGMIIAYQATSAFWFGYNWVLFALAIVVGHMTVQMPGRDNDKRAAHLHRGPRGSTPCGE